MDVHPDIQVRNDESSALPFELISLAKAIEAPEHDVASLKVIGCLLPPRFVGGDLGVRRQPADDSLRDLGLRRGAGNIVERRTYEAVEVRLLDLVGVAQNELLDPDVC